MLEERDNGDKQIWFHRLCKRGVTLSPEVCMAETLKCAKCDSELQPGSTICHSCGWDLTVSASRPDKKPLHINLTAVAGRLVVYGLLVLLVVLGFLRLRATGPGPDLKTTVRWVLSGDDGRAAELVTTHRAHEISHAASRYSLRELQAPDFDGDWASILEPYATMNVRGMLTMVTAAADSRMAPASVREFYEVRDYDGWGTPYQVKYRIYERRGAWDSDPLVTADLEEGLRSSFFRQDKPKLGDGDWLRLELVSAGRDRQLETADDISFISYFTVGLTLRVRSDPTQMQRDMEIAYTTGRHYFRVVGNRFPLLDARRLAEYRLELMY
jgi:hypothetical protein